MWLMNSTRVRSVTCAQTASTICSGDSNGIDKRACTYRAPRRAQMNRQVRSSAPYS
jgi:hypothetical protein